MAEELHSNSPGADKQSKPIPDLMLLKYLSIIPRGVALDLGAGEGRNALFLAEHGFEVDAFDRDGKAVSKLQKTSQDKKLAVRAIKNELTTLTIIPNRYSLAIAAWVLMSMRQGEREGLVKMTIRSLVPGGFLYLGVFSTEDPGYGVCKDKFEEIEDRTFFVPKRKMAWHYFVPKEVKAMVKGLELIAFKQAYELDTLHGDPHYHGRIEVLARNPQ